jgi:hypothetical protein
MSAVSGGPLGLSPKTIPDPRNGRETPPWRGLSVREWLYVVPPSCSLVHLNHDCITAQAQHQPLPLGYQMHDHTVSVLQPEVTRARSTTAKP